MNNYEDVPDDMFELINLLKQTPDLDEEDVKFIEKFDKRKDCKHPRLTVMESATVYVIDIVGDELRYIPKPNKSEGIYFIECLDCGYEFELSFDKRYEGWKEWALAMIQSRWDK